ncbi:MAG: hypothetical protein SFX73_21970 [Kofleriaceae bacterium]|nr:hypothetical protein [Kofleriaceae bacterium]
MSRRAQLDQGLAVRIVATRALPYSGDAPTHDDRPTHVRAASGIAMHGGRLVVVQDDASFLAVVASDEVSAIKLPRGIDGRRRFEVALGNKLDKLDLESCLAIDDELWAFGSGSLPIREKICRVRHDVVRVRDAEPFYRQLREALGGPINIEGAARVGAELWLFHRGNSGPADHGPAVLRTQLATLRAWLDARDRLPTSPQVDYYDLGTIEGARLGFTDAIADGTRVFYLACAELSPNAVDDGRVVGSQLGIIEGDCVRATPLLGPDGQPVKAEGIALDPARPGHAWIVLDPDDPATPATLLEVEITGA